jgi:malic enzyme
MFWHFLEYSKELWKEELKQITEEMKIAAAYAIASIIKKNELKADYVIPKPFDKRVVKKVSDAVKKVGKNLFKKIISV